MSDVPAAPRYATAALSGVLPSALALLGVAGADDPLRLLSRFGPARSVVVLLVDGLGARQLDTHAGYAPYLAGLRARGDLLDAGFPTTTAVSIGSLGTGRPPGEHGLVGFHLAVPGGAEAMNVLTWRSAGSARDLRAQVVPEQFCPGPTAFEQARAAGVPTVLLTPRFMHDSGLTRAVLRGATPDVALTPADLVVQAADAAARGGLVYAYHGDLDLVGHVRGPGTPAWLGELAVVDRLVADLAARLPASGLLLVTGDHGMVDAGPVLADLDAPADAGLLAGVRLVGGEPRARHVYALPGTAADVLATWRERLGERCWVLARDEVCERGWLGPVVLDRVRDRVGDVVAAATGPGVVVRSRAEPLATGLAGHHGSLTPGELEVPLLVAEGG